MDHNGNFPMLRMAVCALAAACSFALAPIARAAAAKAAVPLKVYISVDMEGVAASSLPTNWARAASNTNASGGS